MTFPTDGKLWFDDSAGRRSVDVRVVGETKNKYLIQCGRNLRMRRTVLLAGESALVPKSAVTLVGVV